MTSELSSRDFIKGIGASVTKNSLLIYVVFTILTLLNKYKFYSEFGIDIMSYISLSEVPTLMFGEQLRLFERLGLNFVIYLWAIIGVSKLIGWISKLRSKLKRYQDSPPLPSNSIGVIILGCISVFMIESSITSRIGVINIVEVFMFVFVFGLMFDKVVNNYQAVIGFGFIGILFFYAGGSERAGLVKNSNKGVTIQFVDKSQMDTGQDIKYIGETDNYLFVYNRLDSTSRTIRRDYVTSVIYTAKQKKETIPFVDLLRDPYLVDY